MNNYDLVNAILSLTTDRGNTGFDPETSEKLYGYDEQCDEGFKQVGDLLLQIFKLSCFVGRSATRGIKLFDSINCIFNRYNRTLDSLIDTVQHHRGLLVQSANGDGQLPQACENRVVRDSLQNRVESKLDKLESLSQYIENTIKNGSHLGGTSCMVEILALQAYRQNTELPKVSLDSVFPDQASEELMKRLLTAHVNLAIHTIRGSTVSELQVKSRELHKEVLCLYNELLNKVIVASKINR